MKSFVKNLWGEDRCMKDKSIAHDIRDAHDRVADSYGLKDVHGVIDGNSYNAWNLHRNVIRPLCGIVESYLPDSIIVDAGCGNGQIAEILLGAGVRKIVGIDFSEKMLFNAALRSRNAGFDTGLALLRADLNRLDMVKTAVFDGAILFGVIEHLDDPGRVLAALLRVVKPGGIMIVGIPRKYSLSYFSYLLFGESPRRWGNNPRGLNRFRFKEKLAYYRFYTPRQIRGFLRGTFPFQILQRIPFAHAHLDGFPGSVLKWLGRRGKAGHRILDGMEWLGRRLHCVPGGEYWIIRTEGYSPVLGKSPGDSSSS